MKKIFYSILVMFLSFNILNVEKINAQLTGTKNIPGNYATLAIAIANLNSLGVGAGGVTLNLIAGNPQTAPVGGYRLSAIGTAANTITIKGNGNTITASGSQPLGSIKDAVFMIKGGDYITIDGFTIRENPSNTIDNNGGVNNMTEWGIALLHASPTNGAQNNTIKNCTISLNKSYGNTFGIYSNTRHDTIYVDSESDITSASGANINNKIYTNNINNVSHPVTFVGSRNAAFMDSGNDIGGTTALTGNTLSNWGNYYEYYVDVSGFTGIDFASETAYNISNNSLTTSVNHSDITGIGIQMYTTTTGTFTNSITNNTFTLSVSNSEGYIYAINIPTDITNSLNLSFNISNNLILNCSITGASFSGFYGIQVAGSGKKLNINNNIFQGTTTATEGNFIGIFNNFFNATDSININNNQIGNNSGGAFSFGGGNFDGIIAVGTSSTAAISICNNNFQGLIYTAASTGSLRFIYNSHTSCGSININGNSFTNLNVNTSANIAFIQNNAHRNAGTSCNVNNNSIITGFNNTGTGVVRIYDGSGMVSPINTIETNSNNNFSNITLSGFSATNLWYNGEICGKIISNNIFNNISNHGSITVIYVKGSDTSSSVRNVSNNTISNISSDGQVTGIYSVNRAINVFDNNINSISSGSIIGIYSGNVTQNLFRNTIYSLQASNFDGVYGIYSINVTQNLFLNKIYNLQVSNINGSVYGILLSGGGKANAYNNFIGDLKAPLSNSTTDAVIGINLNSTSANIYFNTIYLNAGSTGTNFNTTGIYHTASTISTNSALNLTNNIIVNTSTPNGSGKSAAYKRSSTALNNYNTSSNNNLFFAGVPSSNKLIFYDGANSDQTISTFKTRVAPRESNSFSENPNFLSVSGSNANFLHIDSTIVTQIESGGINIPGITDDYDGNIRNVTTPDIGADEFNGTHTLNLTALIEGFYDNNTNLLISDTLRVCIRNSISPYAIVDSTKSSLNSSGSGTFNFSNIVNGTNYFLQIKHRNSIETWSASGIVFSNNSASYDFTSSQSATFGNNTKQKGSRYCIYGGDVNLDGTIDASDLSLTENDVSISQAGYVNTDVNGDDFVDAADLSIVENNIGVNVITP